MLTKKKRNRLLLLDDFYKINNGNHHHIDSLLVDIEQEKEMIQHFLWDKEKKGKMRVYLIRRS